MTLYTRNLTAIAGLLLLLLTGCADGSMPQEREEPVAVRLGVYVGERSGTRSGMTGELTESNIAAASFGVYAYYTGATAWSSFKSGTMTPDFMYNQQVTRTAEVVEYEVDSDGNIVYDSDGTPKVKTLTPPRWTYTPVKYWPNGADGEGQVSTGKTGTTAHRVSFFAYAPYVALTGYPDSGDDPTADTSAGITHINAIASATAPLVSYILTPTASNVDLLWAAQPDQTKQNVSDSVAFEFRHALSCIEVKVQRVWDHVTAPGKFNDGDKVDSTRIYVSQLQLRGNLVCSGKLSLQDGSWLDTAAPVATEVTIGGEGIIHSDLLGTTSGELADIQAIELNRFAARFGVNDTLKLLTRDRASMMFIPVGTITLTPTLTYSFVTQDDSLVTGMSNTAGTHRYARIPNTVTASTPITIDAATDGPGKRYTLVCYIGVETVEFVIESVEDWDFPMRFNPSVTDYTADAPTDKKLDEGDED